MGLHSHFSSSVRQSRRMPMGIQMVLPKHTKRLKQMVQNCVCVYVYVCVSECV